MNHRVINDMVDHGRCPRLWIVLSDVPHSFLWCKPPLCDSGYHQAAPLVTIGCAVRKVIRQGPFYQIRQCYTHRSALGVPAKLDVPPEPLSTKMMCTKNATRKKWASFALSLWERVASASEPGEG